MSETVLYEQASAEGAYIDIAIGPGLADKSVSRAIGVIPKRADGTFGPLLTGDGIESITQNAPGDISIAVASGFADETSGEIPCSAVCPAYRTVTGEIVPGPAISDVGSGGSVTPIKPPYRGDYRVGGDSPLISADGNALLVAIAWNDADTKTLSSFTYDGVAGEAISAQNCTDANGVVWRVALYVWGGLSKTNPLIAVPVPFPTFSAEPSTVLVGALEMRAVVDGAKDDILDAYVTAACPGGGDDQPTTAASDTTTNANEFIAAFMLVVGATLDASTLPTQPADFATVVDSYSGESCDTNGSASLYCFKRNVIETTNIGFACTLPESRAWVAIAASFKGA